MKRYTIERSVIGLMLALLVLPTAQAARRAASSKKNTAKPVPTAPANKINNPKYSDFCAALEKQVKDNSPDYAAAILCVLEATDGDETAIGTWMHQAAEQGNAAAQHWAADTELATLSKDNLLSPEACAVYQRLSKVADKGFMPAILEMSECLRIGIGVKQDEKAADAKLVNACKGGNIHARYQWLLSTRRLTYFSDRTRPEVDSEVKRGNHLVIHRLALLARDNNEKLEWLRKAADAGNPDACFALAVATTKQPAESKKWLNKALELHGAGALFMMGQALMNEKASASLGITPDPKRGVILLKLTAALGLPGACQILGLNYYHGSSGLPQDYTRAYNYFNTPLARDVGVMPDVRAYMLLRGQGVKQNIQEGIKILTERAEHGNPVSDIYLAYEYFSGKRVKADARHATELLSEAAATGAPIAYVYMAYIYAKGGANLPASADDARRYLRFATMDMGDKARQLYDELITKGEWEPQL